MSDKEVEVFTALSETVAPSKEFLEKVNPYLNVLSEVTAEEFQKMSSKTCLTVYASIHDMTEIANLIKQNAERINDLYKFLRALGKEEQCRERYLDLQCG